MAHKIISPKKQMTMRQYWLGETKPKQAFRNAHLSQLLKFADDTKCFIHIASFPDHNSLQEDITALFTWSKDSDLNFSLHLHCIIQAYL